MNPSVTLLRVRGIPIGANWSWFFVFALIVWQLSTIIFPDAYPGLGESSYWTMGLVTGVLFVVSLLVHELGHALRALKEGMEIEGITLWIFGGVAKFKGTFPSAGAEFRIAIAGPLVTVVCIIVFGGLWLGLSAAGAPDVITGVPNYLWQINLTLLIFNMIPALPLDGGRVLRATLWQRRNNFASATVSAARIARFFAGGMVAIGAAMFLLYTNTSGLILAFIGWFLLQASRAEEAYAMFSQTLGGVRVRELMSPSPETVIPSRTIHSFIQDVASARGHSTYPVVDLDGGLEGLIGLRQAALVPAAQREARYVRDVMLPKGAFAVLSPDDEIGKVLPQIQQGPGRAVVMDGGRIAGILSMSDVARAIELEQLRSPFQPPRRSRRTPLILGALAALAFALVAYSPPFVIFAPGTAFDVTTDIRIKGMKEDDVTGKYLLTSVAVQQPKLGWLIAAMAEGKEVAPISALVPGDVDPEEYFEQQEELFRESQTIAAAAAARAAGMDVKLDGDGALVAGVVPDSPASEVLRAGDVIKRIDGKSVKLADDVARRIRSRPTGTAFTFVVERDGRSRTVSARSRRGVIAGSPGIGINVATQNFDVDLPFEITFREREIGGPSAGLGYALAVYDLITPQDTAKGRIVATSGTIDLEGRVGRVGGVEEKAISAQRQDADIFIVPAAEVEAARDSGLDVRGVETLKESIEELRTTT
jgi:PDZ domain-containing secreted protein/Zn-dependent protease